jgi:hypothetical protein
LLILHIGTHKTGTTALQRAMHYGARDLQAHGIRYIAAGRGDAFAHHRLAWALRGERRVPLSIWDDVRQELDASVETINIISSEALWFADPAGVKVELGEREDVRIVMYLRRQDRYLQSLYKQAVTSGRKGDFETWLGEMSFRGDYLSVVRKWAEQFGRDAIFVRPYERSGKTVDTVLDFFQILGFDLQTVLPNRKHGARNPSPRREVLHFLRAFNHLGLKVDHDKLFYGIIKRQKAYIRSADLLNESQCAELMERYAQSNAVIEAEFFRGEDSPLFPAPVSKPPPEMWGLGDQEFFKLTVDVLDTIVNLLEGQEIVRKKRDSAAPP